MKQKVIYETDQSYMSISRVVDEIIEGGAEIVQLIKHGDSRINDGSLHRSDYIIIYKE